jgi:effector-binding domain-containing protein
MIVPPKDFWRTFKETQGALSCAESLAIFNVALEAPNGLCLELGTHKGKSAISALYGLDADCFLLVDPIFSDKEIADAVSDTLATILGTPIGYELIADVSLNIIPKHDQYAYVFVDSGSHGDGLPMQEVKMLENRMVQGGVIVFHDYKNQFTEVEIAYDYLLSTGKYEKIDINWEEIFDYVKEHNLEEGNNSWHIYPELPHPPNFVGALKRK